MRRHLPPASGSPGCWRPEVPKGTPKEKVNPSFHGTAARALSVPQIHLTRARIVPTVIGYLSQANSHWKHWVFASWETVCVYWLKAGVCKLWPTSQIWTKFGPWPLCVACGFRMAFTLLKGCKGRKEEYETETTHCLRRPRYDLPFTEILCQALIKSKGYRMRQTDLGPNLSSSTDRLSWLMEFISSCLSFPNCKVRLIVPVSQRMKIPV